MEFLRKNVAVNKCGVVIKNFQQKFEITLLQTSLMLI